MTAARLFLHGMGVDTAEDAAGYTTRLAKISPHVYQPLFYGDVVESMGLLTTLGGEDAGAIEDELALAEFYAMSWTEGKLGVEQSPTMFALEGMPVESALTAALNAYKYAYRYLRRRQVFSAVREAVIDQTRDFLAATTAPENSVLLIAHSLGSVVALDLLTDPEVGPYFAKYISVGSPLGMIARVPIRGNQLLPAEIRQVPVPWIDIAAPDDIVSKRRMKASQGFSGAGKSPKLVTIAKGYPDPHGAYFVNEHAIAEWKSVLL